MTESVGKRTERSGDNEECNVDKDSTMHFFPAIDIRGGNCVRLYQGDYEQETTYGASPVNQAQVFAEAGATHLHVVDLDAARHGTNKNLASIEAICKQTSMFVQVGGGVRSLEQAQRLADAGVSRVVIGTAAQENPSLVRDVIEAGIAVAVGLDARNGSVATHGWTQDSGVQLFDAVRVFEESGIDAFIVTDIARDGTLEGPDLVGLTSLLDATAVPVIASGGVGTLKDLTALAACTSSKNSRLAGAIVGKALYEKTFTAQQALQVLR